MIAGGCSLSALKRHLMIALAVIALVTASAAGVSAQMGGAFPQFSWGGSCKATLLEGCPCGDSLGLLFNPAAIRGCRKNHISIEQIVPEGVPITALGWSGGNFGGHLLVRQTPAGLGFDYNTYQLGATYAVRFPKLTLGITPKLLAVFVSGTGTGLDQTSYGCGADFGFGFDQALELPPFSLFSFDFSCTDLFSVLRHQSGAAERAAPLVCRGAVSVRGERLVLGAAGSFSSGRKRLRAGAEYRFFAEGGLYADLLESIAVRAGVGIKEFGFGIGLVFKGFGVDYAYGRGENDYDREGRHSVSINWYF